MGCIPPSSRGYANELHAFVSADTHAPRLADPASPSLAPPPSPLLLLLEPPDLWELPQPTIKARPPSSAKNEADRVPAVSKETIEHTLRAPSGRTVRIAPYSSTPYFSRLLAP